jgi:hypothetical protein
MAARWTRVSQEIWKMIIIIIDVGFAFGSFSLPATNRICKFFFFKTCVCVCVCLNVLDSHYHLFKEEKTRTTITTENDSLSPLPNLDKMATRFIFVFLFFCSNV